jgi:hypothetical protein
MPGAMIKNKRDLKAVISMTQVIHAVDLKKY